MSNRTPTAHGKKIHLGYETFTGYNIEINKVLPDGRDCYECGGDMTKTQFDFILSTPDGGNALRSFAVCSKCLNRGKDTIQENYC